MHALGITIGTVEITRKKIMQMVALVVMGGNV